MKGFYELIQSMITNCAYVNPTEIYNEGWMTRLLMHYSVKEELKFEDIGIEIDTTFRNKHWTSEALISSPFVSAKSKREGYTHPDIAIGDFNVDYCSSGRLEVEKKAKVFGIIEAKMKSPLSKGTTNAKEFNQASRTVACIAHNTTIECKTFFYIVLPESKRDHKKMDGTTIIDLVSRDTIGEQIIERVKSHNTTNQDQIDKNLIERVKQCKLGVITYKDWIAAFDNTEIKEELNEFYVKCMKWNKIK